MADYEIPRPGGRPPIQFQPQLIVLLVVLMLFLSAASSMFFTINPEEKGVVQRFGKYDRTAEPGLHFKLPFGIETLKRVKILEQTEEFGYRKKTSGVKSTYFTGSEAQFTPLARDNYARKLGFSRDPFLAESLQLSGDMNLANIKWAVHYRVINPVNFSFNVRNIRAAIRDVSESAMRQVVGDSSIDEILTFGKDVIENEVLQVIQKHLDQYRLGVKVTIVKLQDVNPPHEVKDSFNEVEKAKQDKEQTINKARAAYNRVIPKARGEAQQMIAEAEGYALDRINKAQGDADRFIATWEEYKLAKDATRRRLYLETMRKMLQTVDKKVVVDDDVKGVLPLLNLSSASEKGGAA